MPENTQSGPTWDRSPQFRYLFSNHFNFRFAPGEGNITFSQFINDLGSPTMNKIEEQVLVTMSWPQLKMLGEYITSAVEEMERQVGPIATTGLPSEEVRKQASAIVSEFNLRKK